MALRQVAAQLRVAQRDARPPSGTALTDGRATSGEDAAVRTPVRWRESAPPMCIRHELSAAQTTSAPVSSTARTLSASIADETSAFLTANVPPKPQHSSACGQLHQLDPAHRPQQPQRPVAHAELAQRVAGRVEGHAVREVGAHVLDAQPVDEELGQLVDRRALAVELLAQHPGARRRRARRPPRRRRTPGRSAAPAPRPRARSRSSGASGRSRSARAGSRPRSRAARAGARPRAPSAGTACR